MRFRSLGVFALFVVLGFVLLALPPHAATISLSSNTGVVDSGQNVLFTVNVSGGGTGQFTVQLYNALSNTIIGNSIALLSPSYYLSNVVASGSTVSVGLPSGYSVYICAAGSNFEDGSVPLSWSWNSDSLDTNQTGPNDVFAAVGHQSNSICTANANPNYPGLAIAGIGVASPSYTVFSSNAINPAPDFSYNVKSTNDFTVIMLAVGGGTVANVIRSVDLSGAPGCTQQVLNGIFVSGGSENVYMATCTGQNPNMAQIVKANMKEPEGGGVAVAMAAYVFNGLPGSNIGGIPVSMFANTVVVARAVPSGGGNTITSNQNTIIVNPDPTVVLSGSANTVKVGGQNVSLSVVAMHGTGNPANYIYQWYYANSTDVQIAGATNTSYKVLPWYPGTYNYIVSATDGAAYTAWSNIFSVDVSNGLSAPVGLLASASGVDAGQSVEFTANFLAATYPANYLVFEGSAGAPSSTYMISSSDANSIKFKSAGNYKIVARIAVNGVIGYSNPVFVNVNSSITVQGSSSLWQVDAGSTADPTAQINGGTPPYNVIWYLDGNQIMAFNSVQATSGQSENVSIPTTNAMIGNHTVTINAIDALGEATSFNGVLVVYKSITPGNPGVILTKNVIDVGQTEGLLINVSGGIPFYYTYWYINGNEITDFSVPFGSGSITFVTNSTDLGNVVVSANVMDAVNGAGQDFGGIHSATVNSLLVVNPGLSFGAQNIIVPQGTITQGSSESLSANVIGGSLPYSYQWKLNGNVIAANSSTVRINGTSIGSEVVGLIVNDAAGESISSNATINVTVAASQSQQNTGGSVGGASGGGISKPNVTTPVTTTISTVPSTTTIINVTGQQQSTVSTTSIIQRNQNSGNGGINSGNSAPPASRAIIPTYDIEAIAVIAVAGIALAYYFYFRPRIKH